MESRAKRFSLTQEEMESLLTRAMVGRISTLGADGYPYTVAVHFCYWNQAVYLHGASHGEKLDNLLRDSRVCFEVDEMGEIHREGVLAPCAVGTAYQSVVLRGIGSVVTDAQEKSLALGKMVEKYAPSLSTVPMEEKALQETAVIKIQPQRMSGKYHK